MGSGGSAKGAFEVKLGITYDDEIAPRYRFAANHNDLKVAEPFNGDWIVSPETHRNGGRQASVAATRIVRLEADQHRTAQAYAIFNGFLPFDRPAPLLDDGRYAERQLRELSAPALTGAFLRAKSCRIIDDEDFAAVVRAGMAACSTRTAQCSSTWTGWIGRMVRRAAWYALGGPQARSSPG